MAERLIVVDKDRLEYEGIFNAKELYNLIFSWLKDNRYNPVEKRHTESLRPEGKHVLMEFEPFYKFSDYAKTIIKLHAEFRELKDVTVERDGKKVKMQEGKVYMVFSGILETDYEHRWESKPVFYFLRVVFEKYLYSPFISGYEKRIKSDVSNLKNHVKSFLNLERFRQ